MIKTVNCKIQINAFLTESLKRALGYPGDLEDSFIDAQLCYNGSNYVDAFLLIPMLETIERICKGLPTDNQTHYIRSINVSRSVKNGELIITDNVEAQNNTFPESLKIFPESERPSVIELNDNPENFTTADLVKHLIRAITALYSAEEKKGVGPEVPEYVDNDVVPTKKNTLVKIDPFDRFKTKVGYTNGFDIDHSIGIPHLMSAAPTDMLDEVLDDIPKILNEPLEKY